MMEQEGVQQLMVDYIISHMIRWTFPEVGAFVALPTPFVYHNDSLEDAIHVRCYTLLLEFGGLLAV